MKTNFTSYDVVCMVAELQWMVDMRVNQIYDIDNKTYLIRLQRGEEKVILLMESGNRFHATQFEWPKNVAPSGFTIKLRKHLKNKRLEKLTQLGIDRVVDFQFGSGEAAYHVILELYDRGNVVLTDYQHTILNVLRPHIDGEEVKFVVREKYPMHRIKQAAETPTKESIQKMLLSGKPGDSLQNMFTVNLDCGSTVVRHCLTKHGILDRQLPVDPNSEAQETGTKGGKGKKKKKDGPVSILDVEKDLDVVFAAIQDIQEIMREAKTVKHKGFIVLKPTPKPGLNGKEEVFMSNLEYHPRMFVQNEDKPNKEFENFNNAVDEYYSTQESQKIDLKAIQQERDALKKLSNVKKDHTKRLDDLTKNQKVDYKKAELITRNQQLVDNAIFAVRSALANQMSWPDIQDLVKAAQVNQDPVASSIKQLKLEMNHISMYLADPYENNESDDENDEREEGEERLEPQTIDIDLGLSAYANARRFHDQRRNAAKKEQKTIESSGKALKNAEKRTQQALKEMKTMTSIQKARKVFWFEKFYWFVSSENYLIISGRDQQQNELIVKRYMRSMDIYVHADIQGASSVVIRNPTGTEVPPKTLLEAGAMAISYSIAWDAKVVTSAYWVKSDQVSKTAPTGEYLGTGSFMIRGKKNFLPPCHLVLGLSFLFKLEESSIPRHKGERRVRNFNDENAGKLEELVIESETTDNDDQEIELGQSDSEDETEKPEKQTSESKDGVDVENEADSSSDSESEENADIIIEREDEIEDTESGPSFPDTEIKIEHTTGKVTVTTDPKIERLNSEIEENEHVIFLGDDKPYIIQPMQPRKKQQQNAKKSQPKENKPQLQKKMEAIEKQQEKETGSAGNLSQSKRGQKGKIKKIKEKYKDQDEDERKLRMEILRSSGEGKLGRKGKKAAELEAKAAKKMPGKKFEPKPKDPAEGDDAEEPAAADVEMLDSLTGIPHEEDELLFAIPVIAPYQTLQNYKFKVKLTPGSGRRGKASKMAVQIFLKDKACSQREKDLMKNVREDLIARNIPGKVKLSAPQMQKAYK